MHVIDNKLCISAPELVISSSNPHGIISSALYNKLTGLKQINVVRRGCRNTPALIEIASLPQRFRSKITIEEKSMEMSAAVKNIREKLFAKPEAAQFFTRFRLSDGRALKPKHIQEYCNNAMILDALIKLFAAKGGKVGFWERSGKAIQNPSIKDEFPNSLPKGGKQLKTRYEKYLQDGYPSLISRKFENDNSRVVTAKVESILLSIYSMPNKPFGKSVHELYLQFIAGKFHVVDLSTGEIIDREKYFINGQPIEISESTVRNYLNQAVNRAVVDKDRLDSLDYNNTHRPHARRHAPNYSFSKISMDDRDLPRKLKTGGYLKAYYAYDVASGAVIGKAYSRSKDEELFIDTLKDMFRLIDKQGWGVPMEVEVENHLVNKFFDELGIMFPILRICAPGNSQEKHAEHFNRAKKYGSEKKTQNNIGRWWARSEAYRTKRKKVNDEYVETAYEYNMLVADDMAAIADYNNSLHPKQKKYPGMTRWQVLQENLNPGLLQPNRAVWMRSIGNKTRTSITRSRYVRCNNEVYELPNPELLSRLKPGNYSVDAYWLENEFGKVSEVYLYHEGEYLCRAGFSDTWNTAKGEWTDQDKQVQGDQAAYTKQFDKMIRQTREEKIFKPALIEAKEMATLAAVEVQTVPRADMQDSDDEFDFNDAFNRWGDTSASERAINDL